MGADNRTVATDALATLGTIITDREKRDAIHLAVEPVVAGEPLRPGQDVGIHDGNAYGEWKGKTVGIVDPFLRSMVGIGQRFWLVVYPRQITSLRHVWTHPEIPDGASGTEEATDPEWKSRESWAWIKSTALRLGVDPIQLLGHASRYQTSGDSWCDGSRFEGTYIEDEFWDHWQAVTGRAVAYRGNFLSCSC